MTSPGASSVPARSEPIMMEAAPAASAFTRSPENFTPPSEMIGMPYFSAARAQSSTAVICGTPTPATTRVVQMEPGPTPHFTASTPALQSASAASKVATFPATISTFLKFCFVERTASMTPRLCPCAVSMAMTSTPALRSAWMRASRSTPTPTAAPHRSRPSESFAAFGCCWTFSMSLIVTSPFSSKASFTMSSFSMRWRWSSSFASSIVTPTRAVMRSFVITCSTRCSRFFSKRRSRFVRMPTSRPRWTTGMPLIPCSRMRPTARWMGAFGSIVTGSATTADSNFLTFTTSDACSSTVRFLWTNPSPPAAAMAIAMRASVTVSIAADTIGMLIWMLRVSRVDVSTDFGSTSDSAGRSRTSSNVSASRRSSRLSMRTYMRPRAGPSRRACPPDRRSGMMGAGGGTARQAERPAHARRAAAEAVVRHRRRVHREVCLQHLPRRRVHPHPRPQGGRDDPRIRAAARGRRGGREGAGRRSMGAAGEPERPPAHRARHGRAVHDPRRELARARRSNGVAEGEDRGGGRRAGRRAAPGRHAPAPGVVGHAAPSPGTPVPGRPATRPGMPAQADLAQSHRIEQLSPGAARIEIGLPGEPQPITRPSRAIVGIDLGTTNSCAAVVKDGRPYVIPSREGYNTVPSIVALNARNKIVVGHLAKAQLLTNPRATVYGAKRLVGRPFESEVVQEIQSKFAYEIVPDAQGLAAVRLGPETLSLEQISALILREVKEVAQNHLQEEVNRAVITVPAYYNERQRAAVRLAGALAGLHVERILNEPTAAALAYAFGHHLNQRVLVYDLGGGTFDASVLELNDNVYEVVSTGGDTFLGGVDFDNRIVDRLRAVWRERTGGDFSGDRVALSRLVDAAERAKCALSERTDFPVQLPFLALKDGQPVSLETLLSRAELVELVEPLVDKTLEVCREVLLAKGLHTGDIEEVLLVGGQSRMPLVHEKVAAFFGKPPSRAVHPDEAVAIGAALLAYSLGSSEGVVLIDVLPMSIGIGLPGGRVKTIIDRNTPLPARKQYGLATTKDGQTEFELVVYQGESGIAAESDYLGTLRLTGLPPGPRGMVKIAVTFELGAECLLTV